jgi:hypothetical protein
MAKYEDINSAVDMRQQMQIHNQSLILEDTRRDILSSRRRKSSSVRICMMILFQVFGTQTKARSLFLR